MSPLLILLIFQSWWLSILAASVFLLLVFIFIRRRIETSRRNQVRLEVKIAERTKEIRLQKTKIEEQKRLLEQEKHKVEVINLKKVVSVNHSFRDEFTK